ncbi:MAG: ABC transporter transmembrane domain-containing protein [Actinomycetes bacterium]
MSTRILTSVPAGKSGAGTGELLHFLAPFLRPVRGRIVVALVLATISLGSAAIIPLRVDAVLAGEGNTVMIALGIAALMAVSLIASSISRWLSYRSAAAVGQELSEYVYDHTLDAPMLRQQGMRRPSVISRHTSDVDRLEEAVDVTVTEGLPGVGRIVVSLALLMYIEPKAGVVTLVATLLFLVLNSRISRGMLARNKARLDTSSEIGAVVDESITANRNVTGMNLSDWMRERFSQRAANLRIATEEQKREASRLVTAARFTGYAALLAVVLISIASGGGEAGAIAASLLYIEAVVRGLESLPTWLRDIRLAVTSKRRIEQITQAEPRVTRSTDELTSTEAPSLVLRDLALHPGSPLVSGDARIPRGGIVAVVSDMGVSTNAFLEVLSGDADPATGVVLFDGIDVRQPSIKRRMMLLTDDPVLMDASVHDHLRASGAGFSEADVTVVLEMVGIGHLADLPNGGLNAPLGTQAERLSMHERQRLMIGMAALGDADVVVLQDLPLLADPDSAAPALAALSRRPHRTVVFATSNSELAARADCVVALTGSHIAVGPHRQLMQVPEYAGVWERQIAGGVDARILESIPEAQRDTLRSRLLTEHFRSSEILYRAGAPADRVMFVVTGRVGIYTSDAHGNERLVAEIGAGNFCGDVGKADARRTETVRAVNDTMVRTLSVEAWSAGVMGLLDADPAERLVMAAILRGDHPTVEQLPNLVYGLGHDETAAAATALLESGHVRVDDSGRLSITMRRRARSHKVLDQLAGL